jgi:signal transduction histidine kinase
MLEKDFILQKTAINTNMLVEKVKSMILHKASIKNIECIINAIEGLPQTIYSDERRLVQAIINIANNSIKYTFKGRITITIESSTSFNNNGIKFTIEDTGIGMSQEEIENINKLFGLIEKKSTCSETGNIL